MYAYANESRSGFTLVELLVAIVIAGLLLWAGIGIVGFFASLTAIDVETVTITSLDGDNVLPDRILETYEVTVELEEAVNGSFQFAVEIYEDDAVGDEKLDDAVTIDVPAGDSIGTGRFTLRCANVFETFGPFTAQDQFLFGDDGVDEDETGRVFEVYASVLSSTQVGGGTSDNLELTCLAP